MALARFAMAEPSPAARRGQNNEANNQGEGRSEIPAGRAELFRPAHSLSCFDQPSHKAPTESGFQVYTKCAKAQIESF